MRLKKCEKHLYIVLAALIVIALFWFSRENEREETPLSPLPLQTTDTVPEEAKQQKTMATSVFVDVKGAVVRQGIYEVRESARVKDVIALAGGFTKDADQTKVNLAAKVKDEMVVYVPKIGEQGIDAMVSSSLAANVANSEGKIDINTASVEEIQTLHGIGPAKAAAIVAYREEHGPFQKIEDLLNVTGIGEKSLEKIKEQIIIR